MRGRSTADEIGPEALQQSALIQASGLIALADILTRDRVRCDADASSKKKALEMLGELMASADGMPDVRTVTDRLLAREKLGSTALGHGVAIPHGRCADVTNAVAAFVKLRSGVDFDAPDGEPVDLLVGLLVPEECTDGHLQLLAQLAEVFGQPEVRERLRGPVASSDILDVLSHYTHHV
jgi:PTS system nitrogen regulatory IIA component